jgi:membrane fusion protein, peptide pheromone/bacteriocin exporter
MTDADLSDSLISYLPRVSVRSQLIYITVLSVITITLFALPFIYVDVSVQSSGLVRPISERSEIKATTGAIIEEVLVREWQPVQKGQPLFRLQSETINTRQRLLDQQKTEKVSFINDLAQLTQKPWQTVSRLESPLYRQQYAQFRAVVEESWNAQEKLKRVFETSKLLYSQKVIPRLEYEDALYAHKASLARYNSLVQQQRSYWQTDLTQHRQGLKGLDAELNQVKEQQALYTLKAPVNGTASQLAGRYAGSYVQPGDVLAIVSPDSTLIIEAYVSPKDIGLVQVGQPVRLQVDAFDYNQWGMLTGKVLDIANDFTLSNESPVFKVRCQLDRNYLALSNGYRGQLKKGMTVQARFQVTRRSLFQLLYDKADDWLNPSNSASQNQLATSK